MEKIMNGTAFQAQMRFRLTTPLWLLLSLIFLYSKSVAAEINMIDFTQPDEQQKWTATNDNVMGGISTGGFIYDDGISRFRGELSLENNGGFSSINRSVESVNSDVDSIELKFVGDGRTYQLRFTTWKDGYRTNYKHSFETIKGEPLKKVFRLEDFQAVFRGRLLNNAPELKAQDIKQFGFLIADKQPRTFELNLIQIQFKTSQPITSPEAD
ncbi:CIA30 family protein [Vibrio lentus]|uniref:CIA30 family protein n=1 Tax=Vibrio lentus TaxID=136468 RepID=UPI0009777AD5|nr:CIA30 family protein [Vibrio lentus]OMO28738.1 exonuclease [Vibrio lentus]PMN10065.1 exonuclease [Vibrio lentus]